MYYERKQDNILSTMQHYRWRLYRREGIRPSETNLVDQPLPRNAYSLNQSYKLNSMRCHIMQGKGGRNRGKHDISRDGVVAVGPCAMMNGGCDHICWTLSSTTKVCDCALGFTVDSDGTTCTSRKSRNNALWCFGNVTQNRLKTVGIDLNILCKFKSALFCHEWIRCDTISLRARKSSGLLLTS